MCPIARFQYPAVSAYFSGIFGMCVLSLLTSSIEIDWLIENLWNLFEIRPCSRKETQRLRHDRRETDANWTVACNSDPKSSWIIRDRPERYAPLIARISIACNNANPNVRADRARPINRERAARYQHNPLDCRLTLHSNRQRHNAETFTSARLVCCDAPNSPGTRSHQSNVMDISREERRSLCAIQS